jgi:hypothetical protein
MIPYLGFSLYSTIQSQMEELVVVSIASLEQIKKDRPLRSEATSLQDGHYQTIAALSPVFYARFIWYCI